MPTAEPVNPARAGFSYYPQLARAHHAYDDETLYVVEGEMQAVIAGQLHVVAAGETVFLQRGVPHQLMNTSGRPARYLLLCTPPGFEDFVTEAGQVRPAGSAPLPPSPEDVARLRDAAPRFGITLLPGWGTCP